MHPYKMCAKCPELAKEVTYEPEAMLRLALAFEGYVTCGFNVGMRILANPPLDPIPAAPLSVGQREELDRSLAEILDEALPRLH